MQHLKKTTAGCIFIAVAFFKKYIFDPRKRLPCSAISQTLQILIVICGSHTQSTLYLTSCSAEHMSVMNTARSPKTSSSHRWIRRMHQLGREDIYLIYCGHDRGWHTTPKTEVILHPLKPVPLIDSKCSRFSALTPAGARNTIQTWKKSRHTRVSQNNRPAFWLVTLGLLDMDVFIILLGIQVNNGRCAAQSSRWEPE